VFKKIGKQVLEEEEKITIEELVENGVLFVHV